jgi:hypothetical protein
MPIHCVDGDISDREVASWDIALAPVRVALTCEEVRAVFEGPCLARGIAILRLNRAQFEKLFPTRARSKQAYNLARFARRIGGDKARQRLAYAKWHELRAAAAFDDEDAQIDAAIAWKMGFRGGRG